MSGLTRVSLSHEREGSRGRGRRGAAVVTVALTVWITAIVLAPATSLALSFGPLPSVGVPGLPDARTYEQVSPPNKNAGDVLSGPNTISSSSGNAAIFTSLIGFGDTQNSAGTIEYLASRGPSGGWSTHGTESVTSPGKQPDNLGFSAELSEQFMSAADPLAPGVPPDTYNAYLRNSDTGDYQLLSPGGVTTAASTQSFVGATADFSHVIFESHDALVAGAPPATGNPNLYEWTNGQLRLVGILPDGSPAPGGSTAGPNYGYGLGASSADYTQTAISEDGARIVWMEPSTSQLYVREAGTTTIPVSISQRTPAEPVGGQYAGARWLMSARDGSKVFFTSCEQLTNDAKAGPCPTSQYEGTGPVDLYEFDVATRHLTDLSADGNPADPAGANVLGMVGASSDGSYVYFAATGALAPGATSGVPNLYLRHESSITYIAPMNGNADAANWTANEDANGFKPKVSEVTPDGKHMLISSQAPLTGYQNAEHAELYVYSADNDQLSCVSCDPSGSAPTFDSSTLTESSGTYARFTQNRDSHNLSDDGQRVYFDSPEPLLPTATNGKTNVYEWESGTLYLISTGASADNSNFGAATASGGDVFFTTRQKLVPEDEDDNVDLYDARVNGLPPQPTPPTCAGTGCQGVPPAAPIFATPASVTFNGVGNFAPAAKPAVRAKQKPKAKKKGKPRKGKSKKHKQKAKKSVSRRAGR